MNYTDEYKKGACLCHNLKCGKVFQSSEIKRIHRESFGQQVIQGVCPHCGGTYGVVDYPVSDYQLIFKDNDFYRLGNDQIEQFRIDNSLSTYYM